MRRSHALVLAALALLCTACFDEPLQESLHLRFFPNRTLEISLDSHVGLDEQSVAANPALTRRIAAWRHAHLEDSDEWTARFAGLNALEWHSELVRRQGVLSQVRERARVLLQDHPGAVADFFANTLVNATYEISDGQAELAFFPLAPGRLTRRQRQRLDRATTTWYADLAKYHQAMSDLYAELDRRPDEAPLALGGLLQDVLVEDDKQVFDEKQVSPQLKALLDRVFKEMTQVWDVLQVGRGEAYSINELSSLAYDPFPARVSVTLPTPPSDVAGFVDAGNGSWKVPHLSLWDVLQRLEAEWLAPDPLLLYVRESLRPDGGSLHLADLVATPRHAAAPTADEIAQAVASHLEPESIYRLRWPAIEQPSAPTAP